MRSRHQWEAPATGFKEHHRRRLQITCQHVDKLLVVRQPQVGVAPDAVLGVSHRRR